MTIQVKLSRVCQGLVLTELTKERAKDVVNTLTGVKGIKRISIEWDQDQNSPEPVNDTVQYTPKTEYSEQDCAIVAHPITHQPTPPETPSPDNNPPNSIPESAAIFTEIERITRKNLGPYIDIGIHNMGYHTQGDSGKIAICYGTTKVYTTWDDMRQLPYPVPTEVIFKLNTLKQTAIKHFRRWIEEKYKQTENKDCSGHPYLSNSDTDPDAPYRQQLPPGMIDTGTASIDSSKHEGPMPE